MPRRRGLVNRSLSPLSNWGQGFLFSLLIAASLGFVILTRLDSGALSSTRAFAIDLVSPIMSGITRPVTAAQAVTEDLKSYGALKAELNELRNAQRDLEILRSRAALLTAENLKLRDLVQLVDDETYGYATVRVISDQGSSYTQSLLVNAGKDHGLRVGMGVTMASGLAGRLVNVGRRASRVLLITDVTSRIPVILESNGATAVLAGNNSPSLDLLYLSPSEQADLKVGDRIVTSASGGVFPFGLVAATVSRIDQTGVIAKPVIDWERAQFMQVVDYNICHFMVEEEDCPFK